MRRDSSPWCLHHMKKALAALMLMSASTSLFACGGNEVPEQLISSLSTATASVSFSKSEGRGFITTFGTLKNTSQSCVEDVVVEVTYFDRQGKQVDVVTQPLYGLVVPPSEEVSFRVRDEAAKPEEAYASSKVRILSAEPRHSSNRPRQAKPSLFFDLLASWGPMILLIGIWMFFMRKYSGSKSPQHRSLMLIEKQTEILTQQVQVLERLAQAAEQRKTKSAS